MPRLGGSLGLQCLGFRVEGLGGLGLRFCRLRGYRGYRHMGQVGMCKGKMGLGFRGWAVKGSLVPRISCLEMVYLK